MESIDDNEELEYTEDAFNVLGFGYDNQSEKRIYIIEMVSARKRSLTATC